MAEISVIVPVYKVESFLRTCVDSILAQSIESIECILVDDGSPDNCGAICDEYSASDDRVRVIHQKNGGLSAARNAGIDMVLAEGKSRWICFVDSDDVLSPLFLQKLYEAAEGLSCKVSSCVVSRFHDSSFAVESESACEGKTVEVMPFTDYLREQMVGKYEMGLVNRLFHRDVFEDIRFAHGVLHEDIIFAGDYLLKKNWPVACVDIPLYYYRQREDSIMNRQRSDRECVPDRVSAAMYLLECAEKAQYPYMEDCLRYAVNYPWSFTDAIYVDHRFRENKAFLDALQKMLWKYRKELRNNETISPIQRKRMKLFSESKLLYGFNAYGRLLRVYLFRAIEKDPYKGGHGI